MKYSVWYQMKNDNWDNFSNNGTGYSFKEAKEIRDQLIDNGFNKVEIVSMEGSEI